MGASDPATSQRERHPREAKKGVNYDRIDKPWNVRKGGQGHADPGFTKLTKAFVAKILKAAVQEAENTHIPNTFNEVMESSEASLWKQATDEEINNMRRNKVFKLLKREKHMKVLDGRWVFARKLGPTGEVIRHKARWVVKGFRQVEGIDYDETYASVVASMVWKFLLALAAKHDLEVEQGDVVSAFLESKMGNEKVYVEQPHGYQEGKDLVCQLLQALYGLKQACNSWYQTLAATLAEAGFKVVEKDHSVFFNEETGIIVAAYVDDLLYIGSSKEGIEALKKFIETKFRMKHSGPVSSYLGLIVIRDRAKRTLYLSQEGYIKRIAEDFGMKNAKGVKTPMEVQEVTAAPPEYRAAKDLHEAYRKLVGSLNWISITTRPDITYSVGVCCRYLQNPTEQHFLTAKRILRYLLKTADYRIRYGPKEESTGELLGYTDAAYGDCQDTYRSTSGYVFFYWNGPIAWSSQRQRLVTLSSTEAEYVAGANAAKEFVFLKDITEDIGQKPNTKPVMLADNQSAIKLAMTPGNSARTKHFKIRAHFIRECVTKRKLFSIAYVPTDDIVADGLTKALPASKFETFRTML